MTEERTVKEAWTTPTLESLEMQKTAQGDNQLISETREPLLGAAS